MNPKLPSYDDLHINGSVRHLGAARNHLQCAVIGFDESGYEHDPTARAYSFVAAIVAEFNGRPSHVPSPPPLYIVDVAKEYRRSMRRSY